MPQYAYMINAIQLYRNDLPWLEVPIDENTIFSQVVMGEHTITSQFISPVPLDIDEGDYILFRGERFTINRPLPPMDKDSLTSFTYSLTFEGYVYDLLDMPYMHLGALEFSYFGTPAMYLQILVDCMNEKDGGGWSVGSVDALPELPIDFYESGKGFSCKGALIKIAEAFKLEFWLTGKTINLTAQAGVLTNLTFEYGRGRGLYKISRGQIDDTAYFNRLYVQGSDKNIPSGYRNGAKRLQVGNVPYLELPLTGGKKRRANSIVIDDIFPKRVGTITSVSSDWLTITDSSIDFDVNGQRIDGQKATVEITSGENSGQSFEIDSYVHATRTLKLLPLTETDGYVRPNSTYTIKPGDKYFFAGINMPQTYIDAAEADLTARGTTLLNTAANQLPPYSVEASDKFMRDNGITVNAGDRVGLKDAQIGVNATIRVSSVKFLLVDPNSVQLVISDVIPLNNTEKTIVDVDKTKRDVVVTTKISAEKARRNMLDMRMLKDKIFDPDGYFDPESIKPFSIDTYMLSVGAKSQNFSLNNVTIDANTRGDENYLTISGGSLIHYEVEIPGLGYIWQIASGEFPALDPTKTYFVSAKCSRNELTGIWSVSDVPIKTEEVSGFYHFNIGILFPVGSDGTRGFDFTNGMTFIVGDRITTGRIQSLDGLNYFDLTGGNFKLGTATNGLDYNVTSPSALVLKGALLQSGSGIISPAAVYRGAYDPASTYYKGDTVAYSGGTWSFVYDTPTAGQTPVDNAYWDVASAPGTNGTNGNYVELRFFANGSTTVAPALTNTDPAPAGWTTTQPDISAGQYLWMISATRSGATGSLIGPWSTPVRVNGTPGTNGANGPALTYTGVYDSAKTYAGTVSLVQAVYYNGVYYFSKTDAGSFSGVLPTDTSKWNSVGAQFDSVATGLLLATLAYIENLGVRYLSTDIAGRKRVVIDGLQNNVRLYNALDQVLAELDDDSAVEGETVSTSPPITINGQPPKDYLYQDNVGGVNYYHSAVLGPGLSIGISPTDANGYTTLGRKGIFTTGFIKVKDANGVAQTGITANITYQKTGTTTGSIVVVNGIIVAYT